MEVKLNVYDLSQGMASQMSMAFLGKQIDGIWHTGIVVYDVEYFFGGGIMSDTPGQTPYGNPVECISLGSTTVGQQAFHDFLHRISSRYTAATYNLISNNCNNFTDECSRFLVGKGIPGHITGLPHEVLATPLGQMVRPMLDGMQQQMAQQAQAMLAPSQTMMLPQIVQRHPHDSVQLSLLRFQQPVLFTQARVPVIFQKLREFLAASSVTLSGDESAMLDALEQSLTSASPSTRIDPKVFALLAKCLRDLPADKRFPALDLWRLLMLHPGCNMFYYQNPEQPLMALLSAASDLPPASLNIALRVIANTFSTDGGAAYLVDEKRVSDVIDKAAGVLINTPVGRLTAATLLFNVASRATKPITNSEVAVPALVQAINEHDVSDEECVFRLWMALGAYLLKNSEMCTLTKVLDLDSQRYDACVPRVKEIVQEVKNLLAAVQD